MHIVTRQSDYLIGFDPLWGTVCAGSKPLEFPTADAARAAARKARRACMGYNHIKQRPARARMNFKAVTV